ncbi:hypothetical protein ACNFRW_04475, partial [Streptomyces sp. Adlamb9]
MGSAACGPADSCGRTAPRASPFPGSASTGSASADRPGSSDCPGPSNAGRAWCHGASELRGAVRPAGRSASPELAGVADDSVADDSVAEAGGSGARWEAEPADALRARRGRAGAGAGPDRS